MNTPPIPEKPALTWYQRHEKTIAHCTIITGLALFMIAAGIIAVAANCSDYNPSTNSYAYVNSHEMPSDLPGSLQLQIHKALLTNGYAGATCIPILIVGATITAAGIGWRGDIYRREKNREEEHPTVEIASQANKMTSKDVLAMRLKLVGLVLGILGAMVGLGMVASSAYILNHDIPSVQNIVQNGLTEYPQDIDFWNGIQTRWLDVTVPHMHALLWGGIFTMAGGGGLVVIALLQAQIRKCRQQSQNTVIES